MARVRAIEGTIATPVADGWQCAALPAGRADHPTALEAAGARWIDARVPGTAAEAMAAAGAWNIDDARDFDGEDWWFRGRVPSVPAADGARSSLHFGGLATLADVWVDGGPVLRSENMFLEHEVEVGETIRPGSEIFLRFASVAEALKKRRPRPRWRAQIVAHQQLRHIRTTLLGRIPAWTPPAAPVGPYRPITLRTHTRLRVTSADVRPRLEGRDGVCDVELVLAPVRGSIAGVSLHVGPEQADLACTRGSDGAVTARGSVRVRDAALWWPFTHGTPALHDVRARVRTDRESVDIDLGRTGFRSIELDTSDGGFGLRVNGVDVFCRGASWAPLDVVGLQEDAASLAGTLDAVQSAGMNMLRLGGTMLYGTAAFHDACDARGILVWQDFMFANMDYPADDEAFLRSVRAEIAQVVDRLQLSPSLALACGNSEAEQQAAMLGLSAKDWQSALFGEVLPSIVRVARPDVPTIPSTPTGGALPFRVDTGVSHYYGVGAYGRPLDDARRARVRFTSECLAFANVPCDETIEELMGGEAPTNHPRWKARVPRDRGTPWDFDDVRDHYVRTLFGVDPVGLRSSDLARYLEIGRLATGEAMAGAMAEWRRAGSECRGALVWCLRDLWAGAGWGVLDAHGRPKAPYYFLKRALQPEALLITDEGLNGLALHAVNDGPQPLEASLRLVLYRNGEVPVAEGEAAVVVPPRGVLEVSADALLGRFVDTTYAYRFGPRGHDVAVATLVRGGTGEHIAQSFHFPGVRSLERSGDLGVEASAEASGPGEWHVTVRSKRLAQAVAIDARGFVPDDDFFNVAPGGERCVRLRRAGGAATSSGAHPSGGGLAGRVLPLNAVAPTRIALLRGEAHG